MLEQTLEKPDIALQRRIIEATQSGLPVCDEPYQAVADELGVSQQVLLDSMQWMLEQGLIRRIGLVPNHYALGYSHNIMVVWDIDDAVIDDVGKSIGDLPFVSHCYRRPRREPDWNYNFFTMVHGKNEETVLSQIQIIRSLLGDTCRDYCQLRSLKILKKTGLRLRKEN
jgi:DNA-binding Lrp family transcriptional regulator